MRRRDFVKTGALSNANDDDPPSRVARLAYAQGSVSFQPAGTDDWVTAGLNRPVTTGDKLWSDNDGRTELQLDGSLVLLSSNSGFSFFESKRPRHSDSINRGNPSRAVRRLDDLQPSPASGRAPDHGMKPNKRLFASTVRIEAPFHVASRNTLLHGARHIKIA